METLYKSFIQNPEHTEYCGEDEDEKVLYVLRRSTIINIPWLFLTFILISIPWLIGPFLAVTNLIPTEIISPLFAFVLKLFWYLFTFGFFFLNFVNWFFNVYIITTKKIVDMDFDGLLYKNISEAPLQNIEDVTSTIKGAFGTIFNVGSVLIQTSAERTEFEFESLENPSRVRDIISDIVMEIKNANK